MARTKRALPAGSESEFRPSTQELQHSRLVVPRDPSAEPIPQGGLEMLGQKGGNTTCIDLPPKFTGPVPKSPLRNAHSIRHVHGGFPLDDDGSQAACVPTTTNAWPDAIRAFSPPGEGPFLEDLRVPLLKERPEFRGPFGHVPELGKAQAEPCRDAVDRPVGL